MGQSKMKEILLCIDMLRQYENKFSQTFASLTIFRFIFSYRKKGQEKEKGQREKLDQANAQNFRNNFQRDVTTRNISRDASNII